MGEAEDLLGAAEEAIDAAKLLLSQGFYPDAVSRAYYAILYGARAALASRGIAAKTHGGVLHRLRDVFVGTGLLPADLATAFGRAMELRALADYSTDLRPGKDAAETVLRDAERFIEAVRTLLAGE